MKKKTLILTAAILLLTMILPLGGCKRGPIDPDPDPKAVEPTKEMRLIGYLTYTNSEEAPEEFKEKTMRADIRYGNDGDDFYFTRTERGADGRATTVYTYDRLGRNTAQQTLDPNGTVSTEWRVSYDGDTDRPLRKEEYRSGLLAFITDYVYDADGDCTRETLHSDGNFDGSFDIEYDYKNDYKKDAEHRIIERSFCNDVAGQAELSAETTVYSYDEAGNCVHEAVIRYGREYAVTDRVFDEHGSKIRESYTENGETKRIQDWTYRYDAQGRVVESQAGDGSGSRYLTKQCYTYDEAGNCVLTESHDLIDKTAKVSTVRQEIDKRAGQLYILTRYTDSYMVYANRTVFIYAPVEGSTADLSEENAAVLAICGYEY